MGDYEYDLVGNYKLFRSSAHKVEIIPKTSHSLSTPEIPPKVVEIAWDEKFIIAKQLPLLTSKDSSDSQEYGKPNNNVINYWILDISLPQLYGPYNLEAFEKQKQILEVPLNLILKDVRTYQKL